MKALSYSAVRNNLAQSIDGVNDDHAPLLITRQNGRPAVLLSLDDYNALEETAYLLRTPANAARLLGAVAGIAKKKLVRRKLVKA